MLKIAKMEKKLAEEKLTKIDELSQRVLAFEVQLRS